jgi:phage virion morphogenesis protein
MKSLGLIAEEQTKTRFDTQRDPQGDPWRQLSDSYKKRKGLKSTGGILTRDGFLRMSIESQYIGNDTILVGSPMEYADYHQNAKNEKRKRMFLGFGAGDYDELLDAVDEFMRRHVA